MPNMKNVACALALAIITLTGCVSMDSTKKTEKLVPGTTVTADAASPTGYTVTFVYEKPADKNIASVSVTGPFLYLSTGMELKDKENCFNPETWRNGMYATNCAPGPFSWGWTKEMAYDPATNLYTASFPITSGSFAYSYLLVEEGAAEPVMVDDPANPSPAKLNPKSNVPTGDLTHSIVYGKWDAKKQSASPNLDFVLPAAKGKGTLAYVEYRGNLGPNQDLGIYVPAGYNAKRAEPYKVIYASHGGGGNETDWFAMGHVDNIMDNLKKDCIVVTMDNTSYNWDFGKIEDNVLNYIIPYMEANYNVSKDAKDRAFCGLSMGSMTTMNMYYDHPDKFSAFGCFSGPDLSAVKAQKPHSSKLFMTVGTCDIASRNIMPNMDEKKIKYEDYIDYIAENPNPDYIDGGYVKGSHDWFVWSESFKRFVTEVAFQ